MDEYRVSRSIVWFWIAGAGGCLAIAVARIIPGPELKVLQAALVMVALGLLLGWRGTMSVLDNDTVRLSEDTLQGAGRRFGPLIGGGRTSILLADIVCVRSLHWGVWCAEAGDGRRVHWTELHERSDRLAALLSTRVAQG
ncbi:MAG: hypothetical protein LCH78_11440 [Proteobacteria bacterium]|nr:hypothetical protein [Pseudomonadota bacterium]